MAIAGFEGSKGAVVAPASVAGSPGSITDDGHRDGAFGYFQGRWVGRDIALMEDRF